MRSWQLKKDAPRSARCEHRSGHEAPFPMILSSRHDRASGRDHQPAQDLLDQAELDEARDAFRGNRSAPKAFGNLEE